MRQPGKKYITYILFQFGFFLWLALFFSCQTFEPVRVAEIIVEPVDSTTYTTCIAHGMIIDRGEKDILQVGFCWSEASGPDTSDDDKPATINADAFSTEITGLKGGTDYYIKAYLRQADTVIYSDEQQQFTTDPFNKPSVTTDSTRNLWYNKAIVWGTVADNGGRHILKKGICWSKQTQPDILQDSVIDLGAGGGSFSGELKGLKAETKYYVRVFAINAIGTAYGEEKNFTTQPSTGTGTVTDINGNDYNTVKMGNQWWMAENMRAVKYPDNSNVTHLQNNSDWGTQTIYNEAYCYYDNSSANRDIYGALYTWAAAMKGVGSSTASPSGVQGICPEGWHMPSDEEWKELEMFLGMSRSEADRDGDRGTDEGGKLKETGTIHWVVNSGATNITGFTALPGGWRQNGTGQFGDLGFYSYYWTATQSSTTDAWTRKLHGNLSKTGRFSQPKQAGFSVRCVKD